jgi:hypothetical protein
MLRKYKAIALFLNLASHFTAPNLELVEQIGQRVIAKFEQYWLLEAKDVRNEWNLDCEVAVVDIGLTCSHGNQMNVWNPFVICSHFCHQVR